MANSYKYLSDNDKTVTTNVLVEEVNTKKPVISFAGATPAKTGWYEDIHEPRYFKEFLSGSDGVGYQTATKLFDITYGISPYAVGTLSSMAPVQRNIYNQYSKILLGYNTGSVPKLFDLDTEDASGKKILHFAYFINFSRSIFKDKIKPSTFNLKIYTGDNTSDNINDWPASEVITVIDSGSSPSRYDVRLASTGNVGKLYYDRVPASGEIEGTPRINDPVGLLFYEAGIAVLTPAVFSQYNNTLTTQITSSAELAANPLGIKTNAAENISGSNNILQLTQTHTIENLSDALARGMLTSSYYAETEINSSIYFCRAFNHEFNYSSNPTYLNNSKMVVKGDDPEKPAVSYITTVGLYSDDNQLLAVAKLSEPIKKTPDNELIARVRIDY